MSNVLRNPMIELVHSVPGRLRIKMSRIRNDARTATAIRSAVLSIPGVRTVTVKPMTGSVIVTYDSARLSLPALRGELQQRLGPMTEPMLPASGAHRHLGWIDRVAQTALEALVGALVERSAIALVRAVI
jgi:copper chaperone CopZ